MSYEGISRGASKQEFRLLEKHLTITGAAAVGNNQHLVTKYFFVFYFHIEHRCFQSLWCLLMSCLTFFFAFLTLSLLVSSNARFSLHFLSYFVVVYVLKYKCSVSLCFSLLTLLMFVSSDVNATFFFAFAFLSLLFFSSSNVNIPVNNSRSLADICLARAKYYMLLTTVRIPRALKAKQNKWLICFEMLYRV